MIKLQLISNIVRVSCIGVGKKRNGNIILFKSFNVSYKKGQVDYFVFLLGVLILEVEFDHVLLVSLATFS